VGNRTGEIPRLELTRLAVAGFPAVAEQKLSIQWDDQSNTWQMRGESVDLALYRDTNTAGVEASSLSRRLLAGRFGSSKIGDHIYMYYFDFDKDKYRYRIRRIDEDPNHESGILDRGESLSDGSQRSCVGVAGAARSI
jgi:hypothetical protein